MCSKTWEAAQVQVFIAGLCDDLHGEGKEAVDTCGEGLCAGGAEGAEAYGGGEKPALCGFGVPVGAAVRGARRWFCVTPGRPVPCLNQGVGDADGGGFQVVVQKPLICAMRYSCTTSPKGPQTIWRWANSNCR